MMTRDMLTSDRRDVLAMAAASAVVGISAPAMARNTRARPSGAASGRGLPFDAGWRFKLGEIDNAEARTFDDSAWREVDLPHDWSIEALPGQSPGSIVGPFDKHSVGRTATGFTNGGEGWYRKRFSVDGYPSAARIEIVFDGAYLETEIWLNGEAVGRNVFGYAPFAFDLSPHLDRSGENVLVVRVRNTGRNSRWYSGSGLYRSVELDVLDPGTRIARWGVAAWTSKLEKGRARVEVATELVSPHAGDVLRTKLVEPSGRVAAETSSPALTHTEQVLEIRGPRLWSAQRPELYKLESELVRGGKVIDLVRQPYGVRIISFDPRTGMVVNGMRAKLHGGCIHHDNGLLGACAFPDADERRLRLLKARGYNAIRSSHNPASRSLREACDRVGVYLIEEAFDAWHIAKEPQDFAAEFPRHWEEVVDTMVRSARNSPSVIMWSIGNEIPYRAGDQGVEWQWKLANAVKLRDRTRPVTAGLNGVLGPEMLPGADTARPGRGGAKDNASTIFLDVPGYNYRLEDIEREEIAHPERVVYASETFARDLWDYRALTENAPYFLGEFLWTAMDYLGEAGIGASARLKTGSYPIYLPSFPWVNAWCGDIDLIGQQKAQSLARDVAWGISPLELTVQRPVDEGTFEYISGWGWSDELASWSWPGAEGRMLNLRVYAEAERVEVRLNGALVHSRMLSGSNRYHVELPVTYAPGTLVAIAYRGERVIARRSLETVGPAAHIRAKLENHGGGATRNSLTYVVFELIDAEGKCLPDEQRPIEVEIDGPAELAAFGSANPHAVGSFQADSTRTFRGRALLILRGTGVPGRVKVRAKSGNLAKGEVAFDLS